MRTRSFSCLRQAITRKAKSWSNVLDPTAGRSEKDGTRQRSRLRTRIDQHVRVSQPRARDCCGPLELGGGDETGFEPGRQTGATDYRFGRRLTTSRQECEADDCQPGVARLTARLSGSAIATMKIRPMRHSRDLTDERAEANQGVTIAATVERWSVGNQLSEATGVRPNAMCYSAATATDSGVCLRIVSTAADATMHATPAAKNAGR